MGHNCAHFSGSLLTASAPAVKYCVWGFAGLAPKVSTMADTLGGSEFTNAARLTGHHGAHFFIAGSERSPPGGRQGGEHWGSGGGSEREQQAE